LRLYAPSWRRAAPLLAGWSRSAPAAAETWLLLAGGPEPAGLGEAIAAHFTSRLAALLPGAETVPVRAGDRFGVAAAGGYTIDPARPEHYDRLFESLRRSGRRPCGAVYTWSLAAAGRSLAPGPPGNLPPGLAGLLRLIRAWSRALVPGEPPARLLVATAGGQEVIGGDAGSPLAATFAGLAPVVGLEHPGLACGVVDFQEAGAALAARLADEAVAGSPLDPVVAYRGDHRWLPGFEALSGGPAGPEGLPYGVAIRPGGHYLVTGGLGRFGRGVAARLAQAGPVRLTLLDAQRERDLAPACRSDLTALAAVGNEVFRLQADMTDAGGLPERIDRAVARFGPVHGVIHAARWGAVPLPLAELGEADLAARLAPILAGLPALEAALAGQRPDFCLTVPSLAAVLPEAGSGAAALADAFAAAFAATPAGHPLPWRSFARDPRGDAAPALVRSLALEGATRVVASFGDLESRRVRPARPATIPAGISGKAGQPSRDALEGPLERQLAALWEEVLGVGAIGLDDDFFLLGGCSLAGLRILGRLRADLGIDLPLEALFESRTIEGLVDRLVREEGLEHLVTVLDRVEALSGDELDALLAAEGAAR
jgi:NAD(P)-dependent dehydrogenase (short-subunit alcohol dehydrogenase family)